MDASSILSGYGLAGLVIASLSVVVVKLYLANQKMQIDHAAALKAEHDARVIELKAANERLEEANRSHQETVNKLATISDRMTSQRPPPR